MKCANDTTLIMIRLPFDFLKKFYYFNIAIRRKVFDLITLLSDSFSFTIFFFFISRLCVKLKKIQKKFTLLKNEFFNHRSKSLQSKIKICSPLPLPTLLVLSILIYLFF